MRELINRTKQHAELANSGTVVGRRGLITAFDPTTWKVAVTFYPTGDTDYIPGTANIALGSPWVGNGWGAYFYPALNAQVIVFFENGDYKNPIGITTIFDQAEFLPLQGIQEGECWLAHQSGAKIVFRQDGSIDISSETAVNITAPETVVSIDGSSLHQLVTDSLVTLFNTHTHPTPDGTSGAPNQQMDDTYLTNSIKAE